MPSSLHSHQYQVFRSLLIVAREASGLTQVQIAERLGKPQSFISKYERGERRLDFSEFIELADVLHIDTNAFIDAYRSELIVVPKHKKQRA
jgi:transcriptional regulator with XRE-family HTH domain